MTFFEEFERDGVTVRLGYDENYENPRDFFDNLGVIVSWGWNAGFGDEQLNYEPDIEQTCPACDGSGLVADSDDQCPHCEGAGEVPCSIAQWASNEFDAAIALPLRFADGGSTGVEVWVTEEGDANGVIYVSRKKLAAAGFGDDPEALRTVRQNLEIEVDDLHRVFQGEVFYYVIEDESGDILDSVGGFIGETYFREEVESAIESATEQVRKEQREQAYWAARDVITNEKQGS